MGKYLGVTCGLVALSFGLLSCGGPSPETTQSAEDIAATKQVSGKTTGYSATKNVYFGDLHIHTKNSFDAYIFNVRTTPDDVYRFAKGQTVRHPSGYYIKLGGPPSFMS